MGLKLNIKNKSKRQRQTEEGRTCFRARKEKEKFNSEATNRQNFMPK